jgi:STE24 endopeptidase
MHGEASAPRRPAEWEARRLLRPATLALLAGAALWAWGVHALWNSTALPALHLPRLDAGHFFSASFLERSAGYRRFLIVDGLLAAVALVAVLAFYARRGPRLVGESAAGRVGTGMLLAMLGFAVVWLAELPFGLAGLWWERRHGVSHQGILEWLFQSFFGLGSEFVFLCIGVGIAMGLAGVLRRWWWAAATPIFAGLALVSVLVGPYLIPDTSPLESPRLLADAHALERREGVDEARLRVQKVHRFTTAPNAESTGLGPTSTVVLWDTLLGGGFSRREVRVVMAHEIGHLAHRDPLKRVGWLALFLVPALGAVALATRRRGGIANPEAVPTAILVLVVAQLLAAPFLNAAYRRQEAAADWAALSATHDPAAVRSAMHRLAVKSLSDPTPPGWTYGLFAEHPTIMQRIAMARAWEEGLR